MAVDSPCQSCGTPLSSTDRVCPACGVSRHQRHDTARPPAGNSTTSPDRSRAPAVPSAAGARTSVSPVTPTAAGVVSGIVTMVSVPTHAAAARLSLRVAGAALVATALTGALLAGSALVVGLLALLGPLIALVLVIVLVSPGRRRPRLLRVLAAVLMLLGSKHIDALRSTHLRRFRLQDMTGGWVDCEMRGTPDEATLGSGDVVEVHGRRLRGGTIRVDAVTLTSGGEVVVRPDVVVVAVRLAAVLALLLAAAAAVIAVAVAMH